MAESSSPLKLAPTGPKQRRESSFSLCIICQKYTNECLVNLTNRGKSSFIFAVETRKCDVYRRILNEVPALDSKEFEELQIRYHRSCYKTFTSKQNCSTFKCQEESKLIDVPVESKSTIPLTSGVLTRSSLPTFDWHKCVFCLNKTYKKDRKLHQLESEERSQKILNAAETKDDKHMLFLLSHPDFKLQALYHSACIAKYLLNTTQQKSDTSDQENIVYDVAFNKLISSIDTDLMVKKKAFLMTSLLKLYRSFLPLDLQFCYTTWKLQLRISKHYGKSVVIQSQQGQGQSNIVFSSSISIGDAIAAASRLKAELKLSEMESDLSSSTDTNEDQIIHSAVSILKRDIENLEISTDKYPSSYETSLAASMQTMPSSLLKFLSWLLDEKAYHQEYGPNEMPIDKMRKCLAIAESMVSVSKNAFTAFNLGLALQMFHEFGSKKLVETLNVHGFCASYVEVRRYLTSVANHELIRNQNGVYVPNCLSVITSGGGLVQEGADNIDLNTETIDGKDTFHSMARAVFQMTNTNNSPPQQMKINRGQERSLTLTENAMSMMNPLPFDKPKVRVEPSRSPNAFDEIKICSSNRTNSPDLLWVLLRSLPRQMLDIPYVYPSDCPQIPFWSGFCSTLSDDRSEYSVTSYPPVVDSKPSDMNTVFTTMKKCLDMCKAIGQEHAIQTFDQQLYAIAQQVKWSLPNTFDTHILRIGGFHTLSCFIASVGKLCGDGGLRDLLVDSSVYAAATVDQMLSGKQFNRAVRGLMLAYEGICSLWWVSFFRWCHGKDVFGRLPLDTWSLLSSFASTFHNNRSSDDSDFQEIVILLETHFQPLTEEFRKWGSSASPTFKYWDMFLRAVEILLQNIRSERNGSWSLHLSSTAAMLPYIFVTNRV